MKKFDNSLDHLEEVTRIMKSYNKELTGKEEIEGSIFEGILENNPSFQSEILFIMYNEGFKAGKKQ